DAGILIAEHDDFTYASVRSSRIAADAAYLATNGPSIYAGSTDTGWTPPAAGTYYLVDEHYNNTGIGTYEVIAQVAGGGGSTPATDDHGNDAANATALAVGGMVAGTIEALGDNDWFKVDLVAGATYEFKTQNLANGMD